MQCRCSSIVGCDWIDYKLGGGCGSFRFEMRVSEENDRLWEGKKFVDMRE